MSVDMKKVLQQLDSKNGRAHPADAQVDHAEFVDIKEAAAILDLSEVRVRRMKKEGKLAPTYVAGKIFFDRATIEGMAAERAKKAVKRQATKEARREARILRSIDVVHQLVRFDDDLSKEEADRFLQRLQAYRQAVK